MDAVRKYQKFGGLTQIFYLLGLRSEISQGVVRDVLSGGNRGEFISLPFHILEIVYISQFVALSSRVHHSYLCFHSHVVFSLTQMSASLL